jgi:hypothetical protein
MRRRDLELLGLRGIGVKVTWPVGSPTVFLRLRTSPNDNMAFKRQFRQYHS